MSDRDTLAALIDAHEWSRLGGTLGEQLADQALAEGWRPPAPVITDPDTLPPGSIVLRDGLTWHRDTGFWHLTCGGFARWDSPFGSGPITVLYVPTEEASRG